MPRLLLVSASFLAALLAREPAAAQGGATEAAVLRYDLRSGDRLTYRQRLERELDNRRPYGLRHPPPPPFGAAYETATRAEWVVHTIVAAVYAGDGGRIVLGTQHKPDSGGSPVHEGVRQG